MDDPLVYRHEETNLHMLVCPGSHFSTVNRSLLTQFAIPSIHGGASGSDYDYRPWLAAGIDLAVRQGATPLVSAVDESGSGPGHAVDWVLVTFVPYLASERPKYAQAIATRLAAEVLMIYHCFGLTGAEAGEVLALRNTTVMGFTEMGAVDVIFFRFRTLETRQKSAWLGEQRKRLTNKQIYEALLATVQERLPVVKDTHLRGQGLSRDPEFAKSVATSATLATPAWRQEEAERIAARWMSPAQLAAMRRTRALAETMDETKDPRDPKVLSEQFGALASIAEERNMRAEELVVRGPDWSLSTYRPSRAPESEPRARKGILMAEEEDPPPIDLHLEAMMAEWFSQQQQQQQQDCDMSDA